MARVRVKKDDQNQEEKQPFMVRAKGSPVRIRLGPGIGFAQASNKTLASDPVEVVEFSEGVGSQSGWGRISSGGWVAMDFVERVR